MAGLAEKRLFTIAPGVPFLRTLVAELCEGRLIEGFRHDGSDPLALSRVTIYVPTRRAARALRSEFVDWSGRGSAILPVIRPLGETDDDSGFFDAEAHTLDLLPPIGRVDSLLELAALIAAWKAKLPDVVSGFHEGGPLIAPASPADAVWLARGLADLLDAMETHACPWERLGRLEAGDHADWWQLTLEFLHIASAFWPARLGELNRSAPAAHRNAVLAAETARLRAAPPSGPVIVAGSTGSIPATADLMAAIADLEQGALVLPGLDRHVPDAVWPLVTAADLVGAGGLDASVLTHPQYGLGLLLNKLGVSREDVVPLGREGTALGRRGRLVSTALLPAEATALWPKSRPQEAHIEAAFADVDLIEAGSEREEAAAIAAAMRIAGEDARARVALVTPDRALARRVAVELRRYGIEANDSGGVPLATMPPATLLALLLDAVMQPGDPVALTALLDHPLARFGLTAAETMRAAEALELIALRGTVGEIDIAELSTLFEQELTRRAENRHAPQWQKRIGVEDVALARRLAANIERIVAPLSGRFVRFAAGTGLDARARVADWARDTIAVIEDVARDAETGLAGLWSGEAGEMLAALFGDILETRAPLAATGAEWADIVAALLAGETVKPRLTAHPRIFIWGTLEARLQEVDTLVLAGLNEGSWPSAAANDAFLSRVMKMEIGLEPPERRIGLAAHDFQMAMGAPHVVLSRASRADKAPTIASRWLQRLLVVAGEPAAGAMRRRGRAYVDAAEKMDLRPSRPLARRPEPRPPAEAQPTRYSFSEVKTLRRDPYAVYARRVLKLDPLDALIRDPGVMERGTLYHAILERFVAGTPDPAAPNAVVALEKIAGELFSAERLPHHVEVMWRPRFDDVGRLFLDWERHRDGDVARRYTEARASMIVGMTGVTLSGMADRIDMMKDGGAEIIDYKTGGTPTRSQARAMLDPQLALEAAALEAGGFAGIGPMEPASLKYVRLKGGDTLQVDALEGFDKTNGKKDDGSFRTASDLGSEAIMRLAGLIELLASRRRGFASRLIPPKAREFGGDYDHLARVAEWSSAEESENGEGGEA